MTQISIQNGSKKEVVDVDLTKIAAVFLPVATDLQKKRFAKYLEQSNIEGIVEYVWAKLEYDNMAMIDFAKKYSV
jgi:hypothetical protein